MLDMTGVAVTVKGVPLLATPLTSITTGPVVPMEGTATLMLLSLQVSAVPALAPLKLTVFVPWLAPKLLPLMITMLVTGAEFGVKLVIAGAATPACVIEVLPY